MSSLSEQPSNQAAARETELGGAPAPRRTRRLLFRVAMIIAIVAVATIGLHLWQERVLVQAAAALQQGDAKYAHYLLDRFLKKHPDHQRAMALQARTLVALGAPDEAIALFDQAGAAEVNDLHAWARALMMKQSIENMPAEAKKMYGGGK